MSKYDLETYRPHGTNAIHHPEWGAPRIGFQPWPYPTYTIELVNQIKQTKVEGDTSFLGDLSGDHAAEDLVDYTLVREAYNTAGGPGAFNIAEEQAFEREEIIGIE